MRGVHDMKTKYQHRLAIDSKKQSTWQKKRDLKYEEKLVKKNQSELKWTHNQTKQEDMTRCIIETQTHEDVFFAVDTETSGFKRDGGSNEMIQIGIVKFVNGF